MLDPIRTYGLGSVQALATLPNVAGFISAGQSGAFVWEWATSSPHLRLDQPPRAVQVLAVSPNGATLLGASPERVIQAWDLPSGKVHWVIPAHRAEITGLALSPDGAQFATCSADNTITVRSLTDGRLRREITVPRTWINAVAFSPDGRYLASCEDLPEQAVRLWNLETGEQVRTFIGHVDGARVLAFLPDGRLVTAGADRTVRVWNTDSGETLRVLTGPMDPIFTLAISADGATVTVADRSTLYTWNPDTGLMLPQIQMDAAAQSIAPAGTNRLLVADVDNQITLWELSSGERVKTFAGHTTSVIAHIDFSPDGQNVVSAGVERFVRVWDVRTGDQVKALAGHPGGSSSASYSPDGDWILTDTGVPTPAARIWNAATGALEREFTGHSGWLLAGAFSPDRTRLVTGAIDKTARIWNTASGALLHTLPDETWVSAVAFSPDASIVATGNVEGALRLWDAETGSFLRLIEGVAGKLVSISFRGDQVMTAAEGGLVEIREVPTGKLLQEISVPTGFLNQAEFSPDGTLLLTAEGWPFYVASLWDIPTGARVRVFAGHTSPVESVAFSPDGRTVMTAADRLRLWNIADIAARLQVIRGPLANQLSWSLGTLQSAPRPNGPWEDITDLSPWTLPSDGAAQFFRVRVPAPF